MELGPPLFLQFGKALSHQSGTIDFQIFAKLVQRIPFLVR